MDDHQWLADLRRDLEALVDRAVVAGARQSEVFDAIGWEIDRLRLSNERDPDPSDDVSEQIVDEPANDWPGAIDHEK